MFLLGVPVVIALGTASLLSFFLVFPFVDSLGYAAKEIITSVNNPAFITLPFFILSGNLICKSGCALRLVNLSRLIVGKWLPGYLAHTNIIANMIFGAMSGMASASAATIGETMAPIQKRAGYDPIFTTAVNVASAPVGSLIPPSSAFIVYAIVAPSTSLNTLFFAGYLPGFLMIFALLVVTTILAKKENLPKVDETQEDKLDAAKVIKEALPTLLLIVVVIGGIGSNLITANEGATVAAIYSFILAIAYKAVNRRNMLDVFLHSITTIGMILFLIACSSLVLYIVRYMEVAPFIVSNVLALTDNKYLILFVINIFLLIAAIFLDFTPCLLIFCPIMIPVVQALGVDLVHFGVIVVLNLAIGLMTPPVGIALLIGASVSKVPIESVAKKLVPFWLTLIIVLFIVTYIPEISLFLPRLLGML